MNKEISFFLCQKGTATVIGLDCCKDTQVSCCGETLSAVKVGSVDAAKEKHVPVVEVNGNTVTVKIGSVAHPMTPEHYIAWVCLKTEKGLQFKELPVDGAPEVQFAITSDDKVIEAYEFCNLHGVWSGK
ncbi:desulfoferrodoxin family protein [Treponema pedis]|uniref:Desulfoferrodoxin/neelaredoxin n=2 Tax=Treponema pedis TaxID=409322 RepID=S6A7S0_9SPIR|nr:desulfoferrodoxin family protein [Treponema pedis]AGT42574.1 desulfoferrodoxin/neelaredoxin [Treponema pedis str. T A4]QOW61613.1 desulfoferrodoxin [Treponema pedis]QSI03467.1 desulfoferrodoxin [Treponema pedis]